MKVSMTALEEIQKLQRFILHESQEQDRVCAMREDDSSSAAVRESQWADINYLLSWAQGEIWMMQETTGGDTNICLSRVVAVVLTVLSGSAFPLMQRMQTLHSVPPRLDTRTSQETTTQHWKYNNRVLIRNVMDTTTLATCRDFPEGTIPFFTLKGMLHLAAKPGSRQQAHLIATNQNGRTGHSCRACALLWPGAFQDAPQQISPGQCQQNSTVLVKRKRKPRVRNQRGGQDQSSGTPAGAPTDEPLHGPDDAAEAAA